MFFLNIYFVTITKMYERDSLYLKRHVLIFLKCEFLFDSLVYKKLLVYRKAQTLYCRWEFMRLFKFRTIFVCYLFLNFFVDKKDNSRALKETLAICGDIFGLTTKRYSPHMGTFIYVCDRHGQIVNTI